MPESEQSRSRTRQSQTETDEELTPADPAHKAELEWDKTMQAMVEQYGRKFWLYIESEALRMDMHTGEVLEAFHLRCASKLKKGDADLLASVVPEGRKREARHLVRRATEEVAKALEEGNWP